jgi:hypothetical protein
MLTYTISVDFQILKTEAEISLYSNLETMIKQLLETPYIGPKELESISGR